MKILKTDSFVSERIKVQPITNAELEKAAKPIRTGLLNEYDICKFKWPAANAGGSFYGGEYGVVKGKTIVMQKGYWLTMLYDDNLKHRFNNNGDIIAVYEPGQSIRKDIEKIVSNGVTDKDLERLIPMCTLVWSSRNP